MFRLFVLVLFLVVSFPSNAFAGNAVPTGEPPENPDIIAKSIERCCKNFFIKNKESKDYSALIVHRTKEVFGINAGIKEFAGKKPLSIHPIYAYGIDGVAYYEVWLTNDGKNPAGWLLLSVSGKDYPLVNFSHEGIPYSKKVLEKAREKGIKFKKTNKIYRFGVSYFTLENKKGKKLAEFGEMPRWVSTGVEVGNGGKGDSKTKKITREAAEDSIIVKEGVHYKTIDNYDSLKKNFPKSYFTQRRATLAQDMQKSIFPKKGHGEAYKLKKAGKYNYWWIGGTQCLYTQIPKYSGYNWTGCWSGCNNNAWTSLFGWWDKNKGKGRLIPTTSAGETCPTLRNNKKRRAVVDPIQMWFRGKCSTYCSGGGGWTYWKKAWKGYRWAHYQGYGWSYWYRWCNNAGCNVDLANILVDCIANNRRPAHVGANSHFWVGYGFAQWSTNTDWTLVYCYPGWDDDHDDDVWIWWRDINSVTRVFVY
jgi:hypothetical protein